MKTTAYLMAKKWSLLVVAILFILPATVFAESRSNFKLQPIPEPLPVADWLQTHQRLIYDVKSDTDGIERGATIICGPTNAGMDGFAGGPWVWNGNDIIYDFWTDKPINVAKVRARVDAAHAKGLKVVGEMMRMWDREMLYIKHPEWQELSSPDAQPRSSERRNEWVPVTGCWNSPYGDFYIRQSQELIKKLDWDGACIDGYGCWTTCYCKFCREAYKADTGRDIPYKDPPKDGEPGLQTVAALDLSDIEFRQYLKWRLNRFTQFTDRWAVALNEVKPGFGMFCWSTGPGRWWQWSFAPAAECSDAATRLLSSPIVELFWDFPPDQGSNLLPSFTTRYYRGLRAERPTWILPYFCTQGQFPAVAPPVECDFRILTIITNGAFAAQGTWQHNDRIDKERFSKLIREREPWTTNTKSLKWAAMLVSESSRLLYGIPGHRGEIGNTWVGSGMDSGTKGSVSPSERRLPTHMESAIGIFRASVEEHFPLDMISEQDIEDGIRLNLYKVLILPNAACISNKGIENIRKFVKNGGGLVAMQESSLCDEFGTRRSDFGLADVYGASFVSVADHSGNWPVYPNPAIVEMLPHNITNDSVIHENTRAGEKVLNYIGMATKVKSTGAEVISTRSQGALGHLIPFAINPGNEAIVAEESKGRNDVNNPFVLVSEFGRGRVVYFAGDIGQSYFVAPMQYQRKLIANAIRWAAIAQPCVQVLAPMCVQAAFYTQHEGKRIVVHLLNEINTNSNRAIPEGNSSMREEVVPIRGIRVRFQGLNLVRVRLEPGGVDLPISSEGSISEVTVPELDMHSMVVLEQR